MSSLDRAQRSTNESVQKECRPARLTAYNNDSNKASAAMAYQGSTRNSGDANYAAVYGARCCPFCWL